MSRPATPPAIRSVARRALTAAGRRLTATSYLRRWLVLGALIGVVAGCGAIVFDEALKASTHYLLVDLGGYQPPVAASEGFARVSTGFTRPWAIPLVVAGGALVAGLLVFGFAPEAEGHGTDAAIHAVHTNPRGIRFRAVVVKIIASALTIGAGGSAGREGPTGQISAGFGSLLARLLDLDPADARTAVATGIGSGIGSIFGAPLGGAVLSAEIMYRDDFDASVLIPGLVSSAIGYAVFASVEGFSPIFGFVTGYHFVHPLQLVWFALVGIAGGLMGLAYAKGFYGLAAAFEKLPLPKAVRPAIGGLLVGAIALEIPEVLGTGYGWIQRGLGPELTSIPLWIVLVLPVARILTTGLSIGSGGSGGIFGPGMVIGAFVGAAIWRLLEGFAPAVGSDPAPFVIVGMMCCFGSIARAPLAITIMVAEMTSNIVIVAPAMVAVGIASLIVQRNDDTIYRSQPRRRAESTGARLALGLPLLATLPVTRAAVRPRLVLDQATTVSVARELAAAASVPGAPVVDGEGRFIGNFDVPDDETVDAELAVGRRLDPTAPTVRANARLDVGLEALATAPNGWVPVVDAERRVVATLAIPDIVVAYRNALDASVRKLARLGAGVSEGPTEIVVEAGADLVGRSLATGALPDGVIVISLERGNETILPNGATVLEIGDQLSVIGTPEAITEAELHSAAPAPGATPAA